MGDRGCVRFWLIAFIYGPTMTGAGLAILNLIGLSTTSHPTMTDWIIGISFIAISIFWSVLSAWGARFLMRRWGMSPPGGCERTLFFVLLFIVCVGLIGTAGFNWLRNNYVPENKFVAGSSWRGQAYQYGTSDTPIGSDMSLTVNSVASGSFAATVQLPDSTTVPVEGAIVTNTSDQRWAYVIHPNGTHLFSECPKGAVYLQFVVLNIPYFAMACGDELNGVWFSSDSSGAEPEGDFSLYLKQ